MNKVTKRKSRIFKVFTVTAISLIAALTIAGTVTFLGANKDRSVSYSVVKYTYGETYTVDGKEYTLGENTGMSYNTALGLGDDYTVTLKSFTYVDGTDGTAETESVRNAGTYKLNVQSPDDTQYIATVDVNRQGIDFSTVDKIPLFVNANSASSAKFQAHGDIMSVYKHNDGWYPSQKADEVPVEIRTITNAYYYETGELITIKIANEKLAGLETGATGYDPQAKTSTLEYEGVTLNIKDRAGVAYTGSNEYAATFTFYLTEEQKNNYYFDYGTATEDDEIADSNKCLSITNRMEDSCILSKHWFIVKYANLFVSPEDWAAKSNNPYVPFHTTTPYLTPPTTGEGINGEKYDAADTITYTDEDLVVYTPYAKFTDRVDGSGNLIPGNIKFDVIYDALDGSKHRIATQETLDAAKTEGKNTLSYYFNASMPAGHYTLKLYGELDGDKIQGEYWLTVLPKGIDSTLVNGIQQVIRGEIDESVENGETDIEQYFNSYALGENKLHKELGSELDALNGSLNNTLSGMAGNSYWSDLSADAKAQYFDSAVTIMYNRNTWSSSNYVTEEDMIGMLSTYGTYTIYYSVSAKNYVTVGGENDANRTNYGFRTTLYTGIKVSDIYSSIINASDPNFNDVTYNESDAKTSVPQSTYYDASYNDEEYVNVGRHTVTLTLRDEFTSWDTTLPEGIAFDDYFALGGVNNRSLTVYYNVVPANNSWNVMPQMPSWAFNGFDKSVNFVTAGLRFDSAVKYALIPNTADPNSIEWGIEEGGNKVSGAKDGIVYFTVDENGTVDNATAALLNSLKPAGYYLKFFVSEVTVTVGDEEIKNVNAYNDVARNSAGNPLATVTVSKATNSWTSTPNVTRWTFGEYDPKVHTITAEALYPALLPKDENGDDIEDFVYTNGGAALPTVKFTVYNGNTAVTNLGALHAGNYTLATSLGGSDYYEPIAESSMTFTVGQAVNIWTTTPQVVQWTWGNYSADRNIISAATKFTGGDGSEGSTDKPILFTVYQVAEGNRVAVTGLENFQVGSNGKITNTTAANAFAALHAGNYYLRATKQGNNDYTAITGSNNTDIPFSVAQATNTWRTTPGMTSWQYGTFAAGNFRAGVPTYANTESGITYTLTQKAGGKFTFDGEEVTSVALTLTGGAFGDDLVTAFTALGVGDYVITVAQEKTNDFGPLDYEVNFSVTKITNSWVTSPSVIGWVYGSFDNSYFTAGVPRFYESKDGQGNPVQVQYTITRTDVTGFTPVTSSALSKTDFDALNAGSYRIDIYYAASDNYDELTAFMTFTVGKCVNTWKISPSLRSWDYKDFTSSLFTAGEPTIANSKDGDKPAVVTYVVTGGTLAAGGVTLTVNSNGTLTQTSIDFLTGLAADSYLLQATYPGTVNYDALPQSINFTVSQISNSWSTKPRVIGWTYGSFNSSYFIAGVPTLAEDEGVKVTYTLTRDGDDDFAPVTFTEFSQTDFENLNVGDYTLKFTFAGNGNYKELKDEITFKVGEYTNGWNPSPSLRGWSYKNFTSGLFTAGVPVRQDNAAAVVTYLLYRINKNENGEAESLSLIRTLNVTDGRLDSAAITYLTNLGAGSYKLCADYPGTDNYKAIDESVDFEVTKIANSWATRPSLLGWTYMEFSEEYFTAGVPTLQESMENGVAAQVKYTLTKDGDSTFTAITFTALSGVDWNNLAVGGYTLKASYAGTNNYDELKAEDTVITFRVVQATNNNWVNGVSPDISGWTYGGFTADLFTTGTPEHGTVTYTVRNVVNGNVVEGENGIVKIGNTSLKDLSYDALKALLNGLNASTYALQATSGSTDDYGAVTWSKQFTVAKADNEWGTTPSINGWVYGNTQSTPNNGAAKYESAGISGKYYPATTDKGGNPVAGTVEVTTFDAGNYAYVLTVADTTNYNGFKTTLFFTVELADNNWKTQPQATVTWTYHAATNTPIVFEAYQNNSALKITVGGEEVTASGLSTKLNGLGVGNHSIVAYVPSIGNYAATTTLTITLVIEQTRDSFGTYNVPGWNWDDVSQKTDENGTPWQTNWNTELRVPVPAVSETVTAIVYSGNGTTEELAATLHYEDVDGGRRVLETDVNALKSKLLGLHVGSYTIKFIAPDSSNYIGCEVSATFSVSKVDNRWDGSDGVPKIAGWQYESSVANPSATPMFGKGTVKFSYAKAGDETVADLMENDSSLTWKDSTDIDEGAYWLRAYVPGTDDYNALVGYVKFSIRAGQNDWVNNPGVIAWNWNGFNKTTNLFSGSAKNNGTATFKIHVGVANNNRNLALSDFAPNGYTLGWTETQMITNFCTNGFTLVNENGVMVVSDTVAQWLKALKPNTYLLTVSIAADNNYAELERSVTFTIGAAANSWATNKAPAVSSYVYKEFANELFTYGELVYGAASAVTYRLEGTTSDKKVFPTVTFVSTDVKAAYVKVQEQLATLGAGSYTLSAWVGAAANGTYSALYSEGSPYTTRTFVVSLATNDWTTAPVDVAANYKTLHAKNNQGKDNFAANFQGLFGKPQAIDGSVRYRILNIDNKEAVDGYLTYAELVEEVSKLVGEYFIESSVAETLNYNALSPVITSLNIRRYVSAFGTFPEKLTGKWGRANGENNSTLDAVTITAFYGLVDEDGKMTNSTEITNQILFVLNGKRNLSDFRDYVKTLDAGTYQVNVIVEATNDYGEVSRTVQLVISPADNAITPAGFLLTTSSLGSEAATQADEEIIYSWKWSSTVAWKGATLLYGTTAYVSVRYEGSGYDLRRFTVDYTNESNKQDALDTISEYISGLNVGSYTLYIETPATSNWNIKTDHINFTVTPDGNGWKTDDALNKLPYISGGVYNEQTGKYVWTYGASASVKAAAIHGVPELKFYQGEDTLKEMPTNAGEYSVEISVPQLASSYAGVGKVVLNFVIEKALDDYFIVYPGVTGWTWGQYDSTVNVFNGTPRVAQTEGAKVTFAIGIGTDDENFEVVTVNGTKLQGITLTNGLVDSTTAGLIAQLTGGTSVDHNTTTYTLRVSVSATDNYSAFNYYAQFDVTGATNGWKNPPAVTPWTASNWNEDDNMPSASSEYGIPEITIINDFTKEIVFHGRYTTVDCKEFDTEANDYVNILYSAGSGWYVMTTTVEAETGHYNNRLTAPYKFQIFIEGVDGDTNYWQVDATITGWEANLEGKYSAFTAEPLHGLANIVFYVANEDGTPDLTKKIDKDTEGAVLLKKGSKYENDIYIPMAPGSYIMVATTTGVRNTVTGEMIGALDNLGDDLTKGQARKVLFTIRPRALSFEDEPRIDTLLYLGDKKDSNGNINEEWAKAIAKASLEDAEITYTYTNTATGEVSSEKPSAPGKYILTATVRAKYSDPVSRTVEFTVALSPNSWVSAPNIKDWAEEFDASNPFGEASVGTEHIRYTYARVDDPDTIFTERPTTEGSYIMYADIEMEGYEPLHAEYQFTVEPAYETDLLIVDITLGLVACALAIVVIVYARKRYKEN